MFGKPKIRGVQNGAFSYGKLSNFHRENRKSEVFRMEHSVMENCPTFIGKTKNPRCSEWSIQLWKIVNVLGKTKIRGVQNRAFSYGKFSNFCREIENLRCSAWRIQLWEILQFL